MEALIHNQTIRISSEEIQGLYRVILNDISQNIVFMVQLDKQTGDEKRGRKKILISENTKRRLPLPLCGEIVPFDGTVVNQMCQIGMISIIEIERNNFDVAHADLDIFARRKVIMSDFLNFDLLRSEIVKKGNIADLVKKTKQQHGASASLIYRCWSLLCRYGFSANSLRPRRDRCGAPGERRDCSDEGRKKAGRKTALERMARKSGDNFIDQQLGMNAEWRSLIMAADNKIPSPKPNFRKRFQDVIALAFTKFYKDENGLLVPCELQRGQYPNFEQFRRVIKVEVPRLKEIMQKTTIGHFKRNLRGLTGRSWEGVSGPGHTWGIDSTIGDIYLRSSINRDWIIGRPIVYMIVDIWSTAIVGFYVCLRGPSWDMAKVAIFNSVARPDLLSKIWGFEHMSTLNPKPTMPAVVLGDNGEYKSIAAAETAFQYTERLSFHPPYRPDLKGMVEVLHRITKDHQFWVEGAIDARRKEYELRKFDPRKAVYTIREYVEHLHNICCQYNLTADRSNRLDTDMIAAGAMATPAGLWRWGHSVGIGTLKSSDESSLIQDLLPTAQLSVNRDGLNFANLDYKCEKIAAAEWTATARNSGRWKVPCHYYPGSVSRLWTRDSISGRGLLELTLSDQAKTSSVSTFEEVIDAFKYSSLNRADIEHAHLTTKMKFHHSNKKLHETAKLKTKEAISTSNALRPTLSEARAMEAHIDSHRSKQETTSTLRTQLDKSYEDIEDYDMSHMEMLVAVLNAKQSEG